MGERLFVPGTQIEIVNRDVELGRFKYGLFDFDGTLSCLRQGWQDIMAPVMVEAICGDTTPTQDIRDEVERVIGETTGIQTIYQMQVLERMVRAHALVPEDKILDPAGYKAIYNDRLMVPVRHRIECLNVGTLSVEQVTVRGSIDFVKRLRERGLQLYVFSGTDREDVRNEAAQIGASQYFNEIWGAIPDLDGYSKDKVIKAILAEHHLCGTEVLVCGDGPVEIKNGEENGCVTLGVCSNEQAGFGWDFEKRDRLIKAGADMLVADFGELPALMTYLFPLS
ncbi:MAG: HAD hydrolase-like protein [Patescibacteria group bacterium]|nr:HAD hydrolase-like protein [Patescibacteria group bacterium]